MEKGTKEHGYEAMNPYEGSGVTKEQNVITEAIKILNPQAQILNVLNDQLPPITIGEKAAKALWCGVPLHWT